MLQSSHSRSHVGTPVGLLQGEPPRGGLGRTLPCNVRVLLYRQGYKGKPVRKTGRAPFTFYGKNPEDCRSVVLVASNLRRS